MPFNGFCCRLAWAVNGTFQVFGGGHPIFAEEPRKFHGISEIIRFEQERLGA
jgi:hypothetical protein